MDKEEIERLMAMDGICSERQIQYSSFIRMFRRIRWGRGLISIAMGYRKMVP